MTEEFRAFAFELPGGKYVVYSPDEDFTRGECTEVVHVDTDQGRFQVIVKPVIGRSKISYNGELPVRFQDIDVHPFKGFRCIVCQDEHELSRSGLIYDFDIAERWQQEQIDELKLGISPYLRHSHHQH